MTRVAPVSPFVLTLVFTIAETSDMPWFPALKRGECGWDSCLYSVFQVICDVAAGAWGKKF